jgi:hypothetical protein
VFVAHRMPNTRRDGGGEQQQDDPGAHTPKIGI